MNEELEKVMRRIKKLLAIANCAGANPNEAAAAAGMAERIMRKYQIEHREVVIASLKRADSMAEEVVLATAKTNGTRVKRVPVWAQIIAASISKLCDIGVEYGYTKTFEVGIKFFGFKTDVQLASWTYCYLIEVVNSLCLAYRDSPSYRFNGRSAMNSYRLGVCYGIIKQIDRLTRQKAEEFKSTGTDLMVIKSQAVEEHYRRYTKTKEVSTKIKDEGSDFAKGVVDGIKVDINRRAIEEDKRNLLN